ncbi:MAG: ABC transporter permease [bacterium]|jgi:lipopolysaccharide transport system permease protein|nr:ABC transporter permease [Chitinophagaceae bacterium]
MTPKKSHEHWDLRIRPNSPLFDLHLRDVWNYRDLLALLVRRDFVSFYKQTILGPVWFFLQPLLTTVMYVFIFGRLAGLSTDGLPQPLFYLTGIVAWNYFAECLTKTSSVFRDNANIFGKVYFPRLIMPLSIVASNLVRFAVQFLLLICMLAYYAIFEGFRIEVNAYLLLLPVMIFIMAILGLGSGMIISALTTKYRDLAFLVTFGVQLLMYATPVIYPLSTASPSVKGIIAANPMTPVLEGIRLGLLGKGDMSAASLAYALVSSLVILFSGIIVFNRVEKTFIDSV